MLLEMKNQIIIGLVCAALAHTSCEKVLNEKAYSILTDELAFTTGENAQAAVNGLYYSMHVLYTYAGYYYDIYSDGGFKQSDIFELMNQANIQTIISNDYMWTCNYFVIGRANIIIETIPKMDSALFEKVHSQEEMVAEAHFMRAFSYMNLTDIYFQVPLTLTSDVNVRDINDFDSIDDIEAAMEIDLVEAKKGLPHSFPKTESSRPTYGAACGLLCRLYMRRAGRLRLAGKESEAVKCWQKALVEADNVLALEGEQYELLNDVKAPFDASSEEGLYNKELIFAARASDIVNTASWYLALQYSPWEYDYGWGEYWVPLEVAWAFDPADKRLTDLIVRDYCQYQTNPKRVHLTPPSVDKVGSMISTLDDSYELQYCGENIAVVTQKFKYQKPGTYNYNTANNYPIMRFADFILCKAEILNELNGPNKESIDLINRIRARAFGSHSHDLSLSSFADKAALRNAICDERLFEFNMEGTRRVDLIRMGLWKDRMDKYIASQKDKAQHKALNEGKEIDYYKSEYMGYPTDLTEDDVRRYVPIPGFETDLNPNLNNARNN